MEVDGWLVVVGPGRPVLVHWVRLVRWVGSVGRMGLVRGVRLWKLSVSDESGVSGAWGLVRRVGLSLMRPGLGSAREAAVGTGMCETLCWYCCGEKGNDQSRCRKQLKEKGEGETQGRTGVHSIDSWDISTSPQRQRKGVSRRDNLLSGGVGRGAGSGGVVSVRHVLATLTFIVNEDLAKTIYYFGKFS